MSNVTGRQLQHDVLEAYRFRALDLRRRHWTVIEIAEAFGLARNTVTRWFTLYKAHGEGALKSRKAPGPSTKLSHGDTKKILACLKRPATEYGFETPLWTCRMVRSLIRQVTGKRLDGSNVWRLLKRMGLSNQKPMRRALEQDTKEMKRWLKEEYPRIIALAKRWQAMLYFQDEAGVSLNAALGKTWAVKGRTPVLKVSGIRTGITVSSAVSPAGRLLFRIEKEKATADRFIDLLSKVMLAHRKRKVIVITDNAPSHIAKKVDRFADENRKRFALFYLPTYSPELNPDEHVWGYLKRNKLKSHQARTLGELKKLTLSAMRSIQMRPGLVRSFFYNYD
jgi:transposase